MERQFAPALEAAAPLYGVTVGGNDLVAREFDPARFRHNLRHILTALTLEGARVFTITWPDIPGKLPGLAAARRDALRERFAAANDYLTKLCAELGVLVYDLSGAPVTRDPAMWAPDGMHPSPAGHRTIAADLAALLG